MPELTDQQQALLEQVDRHLQINGDVRGLPEISPENHALKWEQSASLMNVLLELRTQLATLPTQGSHAAKLAAITARLDAAITQGIPSLRTHSAYSGAPNDAKIAQLQTSQSLIDRYASMDVPPEARQSLLTHRKHLQSEIYARQSPIGQLVVPPGHREYEDNLQSVETAIQARLNMGQYILHDANKVLARELDKDTEPNAKKMTGELRARHDELSSKMDPESREGANWEINRIRMGSSDTIQGKSGGGEKEGGADQATRNWLEAAQLSSAIAQSGRPITLDEIRQLNRILNQNMPANEGVAGSFREKTETAGGGSQYPYPEDVPQMMEEFTRWFEQNQHLDPIVLAGLSYQKLVSIHPFDDANGRTCRLVVDCILQSKGLPPASFAGTEVNLAVFGQTQAGRPNVSPDEAIQTVGRAVERSIGVMQRHHLGLDHELEHVGSSHSHSHAGPSQSHPGPSSSSSSSSSSSHAPPSPSESHPGPNGEKPTQRVRDAIGWTRGEVSQQQKQQRPPGPSPHHPHP